MNVSVNKVNMEVWGSFWGDDVSDGVVYDFCGYLYVFIVLFDVRLIKLNSFFFR